MRAWIALGLAALLAGGQAPAQDVAKPVKLVTVAPADAGLTRQFFGKVAARQTVDLAFQVGGQIVELPAVEGETIPKGGLVARLDLEPFERAVAQARLRKEQADRTLERLSALSGAAVSQVSIDDARTEADLAEIALRDAEYQLEQATLTAPFDALVAARNVANFTTIQAGTPVVRLHDMSEIRIEIDVPEILFQRAGTDPDLDLSATFPSTERSFPLEIREFNAETSEIGQTFRISFGLPPPEGLAILPGASATVTAVLASGDRSLRVPATAIGAAPDGSTYVLTFTPAGAEAGTLARTPVEVAATEDGAGFRVVSGLAGGEEIVATGVAALEDGQEVRRFTGFPD